MYGGPPNLQLSRGNWTLSQYLAFRSSVPKPPVVREDDDALHVAKLAISASLPRAVYVVDESERLLGTIRDSDLARIIFEHIEPSFYLESHRYPGTHVLQLTASATTMKASSLMTGEHVTISDGDTINRAMRELYRTQTDELPVVSEDGRLVGVIRALDILREWAEDALLTEFGDETESFY